MTQRQWPNTQNEPKRPKY
ncbi:hypothetical protein F383_16972 [Gossypium arboreum]|uniref:Uncharacterized protein n=1 Tax=Gossypium arboreum TaxID=29729 RepID=A0A0B0NMJ0_GOSAR|nr:hypothetical protein F383_16972 [Gossypium arboreum]